MVDAERSIPRLSRAPSIVPPTDLIPAALFLSLHNVTPSHIGRKLRLVVQILALDQSHKAVHVLATSHATQPRPLLLLRLDRVLLGCHPNLKPADWWEESKEGTSTQSHAKPTGPEGGARTPRSPLALRPGEWINVVGWLEASNLPRSVIVPDGYTQPLDAVLDCIHVSMAREPPVGSVYRGDLIVGG
ncbi:hypothetical protein CspeluHIS016_0801640 [Cutaneotrichosporon spelunceum]|uniref:Uncharacterized protein n=1 Tax=Cutaneotrichosporon spelunceum TaxID=1672016 RepID=A0AAD3YEW5_9TREE|nr:hypothetical protein CspeluHIS016_0801640 [Cutaneotrichosporon spelunceum]